MSATAYRQMSEVMPEILACEERGDLLRFTVDGWSAWPVVRFGVQRVLERRPLDSLRTSLGRAQIYGTYAQDSLRLLWPRRSRYLMKTYSTARAELAEDRYKDIYFDELIQTLGDSFKLESVNNPSFHARARRALVATDLNTMLPVMVSERLMRVRRTPGIRETAAELVGELDRQLGTPTLTAAAVADTLESFHLMRTFYRWLLGRIRPRFVLTADAGEFALAAAAKQLGITVIELQHGIISRHSPSYAWSAYGARYRRQMPVPDRLFLYGAHWQRELLSGGFWRADELCEVGSVRLDGYRRQRPAERTGPVRVLVTSQGTDTENLIAFLAEFLRQAGDTVDFELAIKLHPGYDSKTELYASLAAQSPRVQILTAEDPRSTFQLLAAADLHLSIFSMCHYEAIGLGVPTGILPLRGHDVVAGLAQAGHAHRVGSPRELVDLVRRARTLAVPAEVGGQYFAPDALARMTAVLGSRA